MKKIALVLMSSIALFYWNCNAQNISIKLNNPEPRLGQGVDMTINTEFLDDFVKSKISKGIEIEGSGYTGQDFSRTLNFKDTGLYVIGPFDLEFNGMKYTSNIIKVQVIPALPVKEGIWIRFVQKDSLKYLIMEQMIKNVPDNDKKKNSFTIGGKQIDQDKFAEIQKHPVDGVSINFRQSHLTTVSASDKSLSSTGVNITFSGYSYMIKIYETEFDKAFSGNFVLKSEYIDKLPKNIKIDQLKIK